MLTRIAKLLLLSLLLFGSPAAFGWDEVTHSHITDQAINAVPDDDLRTLLQTQREAVRSGALFPDWGHALSPHGDHLHAEYIDAAWRYLQTPDARNAPDRDALIAHFLGAYAHVVEDRLLDATFKSYAVQVGDGRRDDMENGMLGIAGIGYLREPVHPGYVPVDHLARIYAANEYFGETRLNAANLDERMHQGMNAGAHQNALLKLLSFVTEDWSKAHFRFAAAHMRDAPGGFDDNERAVVAAWLALWRRLQGENAAFFVYSVPSDGGALLDSNPESALGQITVITSQRFDMRSLGPDDVQVTDDEGQAVPVRVLPYLPDHETDLAFIVQALQPWSPGKDYQLHLQHGQSEVNWHFGVTVNSPMLAPPTNPPPFAYRFGLWLFVAAAGLSLMLYGLVDVVYVASGKLRGRNGPPAGLVYTVLRRSVKLVAVAVLGLGLWMLFTDGTVVIEYLRYHH